MTVDDDRAATIGSGQEALERFAPGGARALLVLERAAWREMAALGRGVLMGRITGVVAGELGLPELDGPPGSSAEPGASEEAPRHTTTSGSGDDEKRVLAFAQQFAFHVGSIDPEQRSAFVAATGPAAASVAQAIYAADLLPRARAALDALFGASRWPRPEPLEEDGRTGLLFAAVDGLIRVVPGLQALDPVTTELVRLLGARLHACRLCQSLRSRSALVAGADEALFERVDDHRSSDLAPAQKAALAFAEAMIVAPVQITAEIAAELLRHFEPAACVELVLDVTRNATNKVAVALAADAPNVESGVEIYDVTPDGEIHYGLEAP